MSDPVVSVVIPAHNCAGSIVDQLDGLRRGLDAAPPTEIIVVDNRSTDGTGEAVKAWSEEHGVSIRVERADDKASEPYARNVGMQLARGEQILYCDGDDIVADTWIASMSAGLATASYATGPVRTDRLNPAWLADVRGGAIFSGEQRLYDTIPFAHGCSMGFRLDALRELGGFEEDFPIGCDQVIAIRAWQAGIELQVVPDAIVHYRLRPDLRSSFRQGRAYARARESIQRLTPELVDRRALRRAWLKRVFWLVRHAIPATWNRATRARWVWSASLVIGAAGSTMGWRHG